MNDHKAVYQIDDSPKIKLLDTIAEIQDVLKLQARNTLQGSGGFPKDGFVTARHSPELLKQMSLLSPQIIAVTDLRVVAYALTMHLSLSQEIAVLKPMFDLFDHVNFEGKVLSSYRLMVAGQTCIDQSFRGTGLLDELYARMKSELFGRYDLLVTEIAVANHRSLRAHQRIGFQIIHVYHDGQMDWNLVGWKLNKQHKNEEQYDDNNKLAWPKP